MRCISLLPLAFALSLQLVQEQKVAVRRAIEDAADRLPWWVQPVLPRGSLFDNAGLVHGAGGFEQLNVPYSGKKTALFEPFIYKMHYFTKTGSGQT